MWLTMEPTGGGPGAWPELELVNSASQRAMRAAGEGSRCLFSQLFSGQSLPMHSKCRQ